MHFSRIPSVFLLFACTALANAFWGAQEDPENLIPNGGFENGTLDPWAISTQGTRPYFNFTAYDGGDAAYEGQYYFEIKPVDYAVVGTAQVFLSQTLTNLVNGQKYNISMAQGSHTSGPLANRISVTLSVCPDAGSVCKTIFYGAACRGFNCPEDHPEQGLAWWHIEGSEPWTATSDTASIQLFLDWSPFENIVPILLDGFSMVPVA
ncbi:hypothetical protein F4778DRAFT_765144 [Xylariomycetidae sp. FL2044]|nr:hypothetical protein F4778DRAFT_765144 [Xylariomycetidae sp. FL2044]